MRLPFLDTLLSNENGKLQTDIYYKPTDSKQYFLYTSCHPKHTRNSIPYNLARRLKMIVSEDNTLLVRLEELKTFLLKQKYSSSLIDDSIILYIRYLFCNINSIMAYYHRVCILTTGK